MSRNRKRQSAALRFGPALKVVLLCLLIGGSSVGYVWQKDQINKLGIQIKASEIRLGALIEGNEQRRKQLGDMRSPTFIVHQIQKLDLGLVEALPSQVWRLNEPNLPQEHPEHAAGDYIAQSVAAPQ